jgi:hypothetical protein
LLPQRGAPDTLHCPAAAAAAAVAVPGNRLEALVRCSLPSASSSTELILSATNQNDPFNPGNNASFSEDFFRVWQDEVARIKIVVRLLLLAVHMKVQFQPQTWSANVAELFC